MEKIIVYLDTKDIIEIAKTFKNNNEELKSKILDLNKKNNIIFPISTIHLLEFSAVKNISQKEDATETLKLISKNKGIKTITDVMRYEIKNMLIKEFNLNFPYLNIKEEIITNGIDIFGSYCKEINNFELTKDILKDDWIEFFLSEENPKIKNTDTNFIEFVNEIEKNRKYIEEKKIKRPQLIDNSVLGLMNDFKNIVHEIILDLNTNNTKLNLQIPKDNFFSTENLLKIPTIEIWSKLHLLYWTNKEMKIQVNDLYDFWFLSVAIPYCDVVTLDNKMKSVLTTFKILEKYNTKIFAGENSLKETLKFLENIK